VDPSPRSAFGLYAGRITELLWQATEARESAARPLEKFSEATADRASGYEHLRLVNIRRVASKRCASRHLP